VPSEQRNLVRQLAALVERYHGEGAAARRIPIDRQILRVDLNDGRHQHSHSPPLLQPGACVYPHRRALRAAGGRNRREKTHLDQVRVPGIAADVEVIVAELLSRRLPEDVSYKRGAKTLCLVSAEPDLRVAGRESERRHGGRTHGTSTRAQSGQP
jgi:hypothetical protein